VVLKLKNFECQQGADDHDPKKLVALVDGAAPYFAYIKVEWPGPNSVIHDVPP
jgi:hypothetical protein